MPTMPHGFHRSKVHRLFVAAYPPLEASENLLQQARAAADLPGRWTAPEQLHLTLLFIGETDARQLASVSESVERACAGLRAFDLSPTRLRTLPERGEIRLLAVQTDAPPTLLELQRRLVHRLARPAQRARADTFLPHLTLVRFPHDARVERLDRDLEAQAFRIDRVRLMESRLGQRGASHHEAASFPLEAP